MRKEEKSEGELRTYVWINGQQLDRIEKWFPHGYEVSNKTLMSIGDLVTVKRKYHAGSVRRVPGWQWKLLRGKLLRINGFRLATCGKGERQRDDIEVCVLVDTWIRHQAIVIPR